MKAKILSLAIFLFLSGLLYGQSKEPRNHYVVIGAFRYINNAIRWTDKANKDNFSAQYAMNPANRLYYVYLLNTTDRRKAFALAIKMRVETEHKECWVFIGNLGEEKGAPVVEKPIEKPVEEKPIEPVVEKKDSVIIEPIVKVDSSVFKKPEEPKPVVKKPEGTPFIFKLVNANTGNPVTGVVHIQESTKATQYQAFKANEIAYIKAPLNRNGTYTMLTNAPGYEQVKSTINFKDPGVEKGADDEFIISIPMVKARKGDYIDFNNVHFVRNSTVMNPESQNELDGLVDLMKENLKYKIKIHAHCNGDQTREIIVRGTSDNFFAMDPAHNKKETASAKVLTDERGKAVKAYMVSQGIAEGRISTRAEGGKIALYPEGSTLANLNDRIEVEVKKD